MGEDNAYNGRRAMQVQLSRLFGSKSTHAKGDKRTAAQWRKTLKAVLTEIDRYIAANVDTDDFHKLTLLSGLCGANEALKDEDFWPGYVEGITRVALILLGDYPDHRKRKPGRKQADHYKLDLERTLQWAQTPDQRLRVLIHAGQTGFPTLSECPLDVLRKFRDQYGFKPTQTDFLEWYRAKFPQDYAAVFR